MFLLNSGIGLEYGLDYVRGQIVPSLPQFLIITHFTSVMDSLHFDPAPAVARYVPYHFGICKS